MVIEPKKDSLVERVEDGNKVDDLIYKALRNRK